MRTSAEILKAAADQLPDPDFLDDKEIDVRREGYSRARHLFVAGGRTVARLRWRGRRRALYDSDGMRLEIAVGPLDRKISAVSSDGARSVLTEGSRANPHREDLRIEMAEGDNFCLTKKLGKRLRTMQCFDVYKEFSNCSLMALSFDGSRRSQTAVTIRFNEDIRGETRFVHRLLALIVCRIILDRRHSGLPRIRKKEPRRIEKNRG